jgi:hypothetical protein
MLRHLRKVYIQFAAGDVRSKSARELLQRLGCDKARKSNADCSVEFTITENPSDNDCYVDLTFVDNDQRRISTADRKTDDIMRVIQSKAKEMEMRDVMKEVAFDPWNSKNRIQGV